MKGPEGIVASLVEKVLRTIRRHDLIGPGDRIVVAVSGGPDSVALLHVLSQLAASRHWELAVAHLHHGIRGREADEDLEFVEGISRSLGLTLFKRTHLQGALKRMPGSLQETARRARYAFLDEVRRQWGGHKIALGHQADDQAETILSAFLRGAATHGLAGMPYARGAVVRPLLDVTRQEILSYLLARSIPFRHDSSNDDLSYRRNQIRHEILPLLRGRFNPRLDAVLRQTARACAADDELLERQTESLWHQGVQWDARRVEVPHSLYLGCHRALQYRLLRRAYAHLRGDTRRLAHVHLEAMQQIAQRGGKERWYHLPGGIRFVASGHRLVFGFPDNLAGGLLCHPVSFPGETRLPESNLVIRWELLEGRPPHGWRDEGNRVYMDREALVGEVILRSPAPGDRLRPLGLGGTRKVQDILVDRRVPRRDRWRSPLMVDARGVVWVVGHRLDERVAVHPGTRRIVRATVMPLRRDSA